MALYNEFSEIAHSIQAEPFSFSVVGGKELYTDSSTVVHRTYSVWKLAARTLSVDRQPSSVVVDRFMENYDRYLCYFCTYPHLVIIFRIMLIKYSNIIGQVSYLYPLRGHNKDLSCPVGTPVRVPSLLLYGSSQSVHFFFWDSRFSSNCNLGKIK